MPNLPLLACIFKNIVCKLIGTTDCKFVEWISQISNISDSAVFREIQRNRKYSNSQKSTAIQFNEVENN